MAVIPYICLRKGLMGEAEQRAAMAAAGASPDDLAEAYRDDCRKQPGQPQRNYIIGAARKGDEVLVARLGVLATTHEDALLFVAAISAHGTALRDASTGRRYSVRPEASQDVSDALTLAADIAADEARARMEKARSHIKARPGKAPEMDDAARERARVYWHDQSLTNAEAIAKIGGGFKERMLYAALGKRHRPAFGKMTSKRRTKPDAK